MTPIEIADKMESYAIKFAGKYKEAEEAALAARCIHACIEAAKEENWAKFKYGGNALFEASCAKEFLPELKEENGFDFFNRALMGEESNAKD